MDDDVSDTYDIPGVSELPLVLTYCSFKNYLISVRCCLAFENSTTFLMLLFSLPLSLTGGYYILIVAHSDA